MDFCEGREVGIWIYFTFIFYVAARLAQHHVGKGPSLLVTVPPAAKVG